MNTALNKELTLLHSELFNQGDSWGAEIIKQAQKEISDLSLKNKVQEQNSVVITSEEDEALLRRSMEFIGNHLRLFGGGVVEQRLHDELVARFGGIKIGLPPRSEAVSDGKAGLRERKS